MNERAPLDQSLGDRRNRAFTAATELADESPESNRKPNRFRAKTAGIAGKSGRGGQHAGGNFETTTAGAVPVLAVAGVVIRYFYAVGSPVIGVIGLGILSVWKCRSRSMRRRRSASPPASSPARRHSGHVVSGSRFGRAEVLQYGQLHNRNTDLAVALIMPPKGIGMGTQLVQDLNDVNLLRSRRPMILTQTHYDLDTRFGEYRATEMRVDTDGRWKQCLAFRSRFETTAVYLTGWYCDGTGSKPSANALACILDKLVIEGELASKEADTFLRGRMAKPGHCQAEPVTQTDTGHRGVSPPSRWSQPSATYRRY